jgi:HSP20 family protein
MTSLIRFSPTTEMRRLQREIDRLFEGAWSTQGNENRETDTTVWTPRVDLSETEDAYVIHLDVPGMAKDELEISYQDHTLSVSGERTVAAGDENRNFVRIERSFGRFYRAFTLPKAVDDTKIKANYTDGVLVIHVPKAEESKPRRIKVS